MAISETPLPADSAPFHVVPQLFIAVHGLSIITTDELTVRLSSRNGEIELSQRQFAALMQFARHILRHEYDD